MMLWAEGGGEAMATVVGGESVDVVKTRDVDVRELTEGRWLSQGAQPTR
eukprot:SAG31_NODE_4454_length_3218_cov_2.758576_1_plen_48_part_10